MKLAVTQIALGALIVFFSCFIVAGGHLSGYTITVPESVLREGISPSMTIESRPSIFTVMAVSSTLILGFAVLGTGIAQLVKARNKKI
jgi:hypothetical protein